MRCFKCGAETAVSWRFSGLFSQLPPDKRRRMWTCPAHEAEASARRDAAAGVAMRNDTHAAAPVAPTVDVGRRVAGGDQGNLNL